MWIRGSIVIPEEGKLLGANDSERARKLKSQGKVLSILLVLKNRQPNKKGGVNIGKYRVQKEKKD